MIQNSTSAKQEWDIVIKSQTNLFDFKLNELSHYRDLIWQFVRRDFVAQYKQTILGPVWHFIQPVFTTLMYLIVFSRIARLPTDGIEPVLFYLSGITIWTYFSTSLINTSNTFTGNAAIFGKVYFPRLIIPLSSVISNIVKFGIQFLLLFVAMLWYQFHGSPILFNTHWLYIPLLVILLAGIGLGCGIIISSVTTKYRDFTVLLAFAIQLMMYITPVIYPLSFFNNSHYKWIIDLNPLTPVVEGFRYCLFGKGSVIAGSIMYSMGFMIVSLLTGTIMFNKVERSFMDTV